MKKVHKPDGAARRVARAILARAADGNPDPLDSVGATLRAYASIRARLSQFLGPAGFDALMARSLALAARDRPEFSGLRVSHDGVIQGLREYADGRPVKEVLQGLEELVAQLIHLIATFIGEDLTARLMAESGTPASDDSAHTISGETLQ